VLQEEKDVAVHRDLGSVIGFMGFAIA